ncbi:MAG: hypothetical protein JOZ91_11370 [Candidatus Eremiobacteraeota bacterium]|nr:hypothetical protein [Candidatus Eremiobacteraeota bacterium]MBV8595657.1 hypothetical protein [Candidatus Eremiobacteraeota bacterium]MBV8668881.1 hypothetical protein [Candidatus Eremiobacteraeota bacterium]
MSRTMVAIRVKAMTDVAQERGTDTTAVRPSHVNAGAAALSIYEFGGSRGVICKGLWKLKT